MSQIEDGELADRPRLLRAPLAGVAAAFAAGVIAGRYVPLILPAWAAFGVLALAAAAVTFRRPHLQALTTVSLIACVFSLGAGRTRVAYHSVADDDIVTYTGPRPILATVRGRIVTSPQVYDRSASVAFGYKPGPRTSFVLAARQIRTADGWRPVSGLANVTLGQGDDRLTAGQEVELVCRLSRPRPPGNPGQFDAAAKARLTRVLTNISVPASDGVTVLGDQQQPWYARGLWNVRAAARQHLACCGDDNTAPLMNALIIGERQPAVREMNRQMVRTGVAHFLSISGLHLGVFLGFVYLLCRLTALAPRRSAVVVLVVLAAYVLLAEPRAPLLRSAVMAAAICAAVIFRRSLHPLNALALAGLVLLAFDPLQLFDAGFQLSFAIVGGLVVLHAPARKALFAPILRRRGLVVFRDEHRTRRRLYHTAGDWLMNAVSLCLVAYVLAAPLAAYHFGFFSPYAPLLSLALFPLVTAVLVPGYLSMAMAAPMPNLAYAVGRLSALAADALAAVVNVIGLLPGACMELRHVPLAWVLLCYALIVLIWQRRRIRFGRTLATVAAVTLAALTVWTQLPARAPKTPELHLVAVGDGQCAILRTASGRCFVFDAGTRSGYDACAAALNPFLRRMGLPQPEAAFISHANTDHFSAIPGLIERGALRRVYVNKYFGCDTGDETEGKEAARFLDLCDKAGVEVIRVAAGEVIGLDNQTTVKVLWPPRDWNDDLAKDPNESSLVLRVDHGGRRILLPGDIGPAAQGALAADEGQLRADVLVAPHHGGWSDKKMPSGENVSVEFLRTVAARIVLVSQAREPVLSGRASDARRTFHALTYSEPGCYSTAADGCIRVELDAYGPAATPIRRPDATRR